MMRTPTIPITIEDHAEATFTYDNHVSPVGSVVMREMQQPWPPPAIVCVPSDGVEVRPMPWPSFGAYYARLQLNSWGLSISISSVHTVLTARFRAWMLRCGHCEQGVDCFLSCSDARHGRCLLNGLLELYKHANRSSTENKDWRQYVLVSWGQMVLKAIWWPTVIFNFSTQIKIASDAFFQFRLVSVQAWKDLLEGINSYPLMRLPPVLRCHCLLFCSNVEAFFIGFGIS
ncbi:hypothetical protein BS78_07G045900 [Paspalum vaginatum]|nr:hypothetical protein BS78_07G045900 [Paspalum vaginatum]